MFRPSVSGPGREHPKAAKATMIDYMTCRTPVDARAALPHLIGDAALATDCRAVTAAHRASPNEIELQIADLEARQEQLWLPFVHQA